MLLDWAVAVVAPHGATDICRHSLFVVVATHALAAICCSNIRERRILLAGTSIWHMAGDFAGLWYTKLACSLLLHVTWLLDPASCIAYLACVHTPFHYSREIAANSGMAILMAIASVISFKFWREVNRVMLGAVGPLWWVAPVAAHAVLDGVARLRSFV